MNDMHSALVGESFFWEDFLVFFTRQEREQIDWNPLLPGGIFI